MGALGRGMHVGPAVGSSRGFPGHLVTVTSQEGHRFVFIQQTLMEGVWPPLCRVGMPQNLFSKPLIAGFRSFHLPTTDHVAMSILIYLSLCKRLINALGDVPGGGVLDREAAHLTSGQESKLLPQLLFHTPSGLCSPIRADGSSVSLLLCWTGREEVAKDPPAL